jgi:hypothetical protein
VCAVKECQDNRLKVLSPTKPLAYFPSERGSPPKRETDREKKEVRGRRAREKRRERE